MNRYKSTTPHFKRYQLTLFMPKAIYMHSFSFDFHHGLFVLIVLLQIISADRHPAIMLNWRTYRTWATSPVKRKERYTYGRPHAGTRSRQKLAQLRNWEALWAVTKLYIVSVMSGNQDIHHALLKLIIYYPDLGDKFCFLSTDMRERSRCFLGVLQMPGENRRGVWRRGMAADRRHRSMARGQCDKSLG